VQYIDVKKRFGDTVRFWRSRRGITQEALAERADVHRTYICDLEGGTRNVSLEIIDRLAQALEIPASDLFSNRTGPATEGKTSKTVAAKQLINILLVEDNLDDSDLTLWALKQGNIANHVDVVDNGAAALDYLQCKGAYSKRKPDNHPQLVLLDLNLPKINGLEVLRQIKSDPQTRDIPVVVLTVSSRSQDVVTSRQLGASAYIVKPVSLQNFSETIPKLDLEWAVLKPSRPLKHEGRTTT
jgi:two-component system response regulator